MSFFSKIFNSFDTTSAPIGSGRILPDSGRVSQDTSDKLPFALRIREEKDGNKTQQYIDLDLKSIGKRTPRDLYKILVDSDPEVSLALYHFQRFCNPGYTIEALNVGQDTTNVPAQVVIDDFLRQMESLYGGFDIVLGRLFYSVFIGGAVFCELVLDNMGMDMIDFIAIDPHEARFRKITDPNQPERGEIWDLGQMQDGDFSSLAAYDTVTYMPFDPAVGSPYGRAIISPTIFSTLFLTSLLRDLERVIRHQGWQRLDIILDISKIDFGTADEKEKAKIINDQIDTICRQYQTLKPDDVFVHTNQFEFGQPVGTTNRLAMQGIDELIRTLERRTYRALKSNPLLMGSNETVTETHANRQWEIYVASIRSIQSLVIRSVSNLLKVGLSAQGIQSDVRIVFDEVRDSERIRYAQAEQIELQNLRTREEQEWITKEEAAEQSQLIGQ